MLTLRTFEDALAMREALAPGLRLAVVGAGLIGLEVAGTTRAGGAAVTVFDVAEVPMAPVLGRRVGAWLADRHRAAGVALELGAPVAPVEPSGAVRALRPVGRDSVPCDLVVVAIGVVPDVAWVAGSGLDPTGIAVDAGGRTGLPGVLAAGDAARPWDPVEQRHVWSGHWEAAARGGMASARTILGLPEPPPATPSFWSDQHGMRLQCVGRPWLADAAEPDSGADGELTVVYSRAGQPVAGLAVDRPHEVPRLRRLLQPQAPERRAA